jgi:hypothetical protein
VVAMVIFVLIVGCDTAAGSLSKLLLECECMVEEDGEDDDCE